MTPEQLAILKAYILADSVLSTKISGEGTDFSCVADTMNAIRPTFFVWRKSVSPQELRAAAMIGAAQLDGLTQSKRDSLLWVIGEAIDFTVATNRTAIDDLCGSQQVLKAALQAVQREPCTLAQSLLATGTGTIASPAILTFAGVVSVSEINSMFAAPRAMVQ